MLWLRVVIPPLTVVLAGAWSLYISTGTRWRTYSGVPEPRRARYPLGVGCPPDTCPICGMHDPDELTRWGGRQAHETCVEWLGDPLQTPLDCHEQGPGEAR